MSHSKHSHFLDPQQSSEPSYRIEEFMHISDNKKPWWFDKAELERLVEVLTQSGDGHRWRIEDETRFKLDDRVVIRGGAYDFHIRKKFILAEGRPVYDTSLDGVDMHTNDFGDVAAQLSQYVKSSQGLNDLMDRMVGALTPAELKHD